MRTSMRSSALARKRSSAVSYRAEAIGISDTARLKNRVFSTKIRVTSGLNTWPKSRVYTATPDSVKP